MKATLGRYVVSLTFNLGGTLLNVRKNRTGIINNFISAACIYTFQKRCKYSVYVFCLEYSEKCKHLAVLQAKLMNPHS